MLPRTGRSIAMLALLFSVACGGDPVSPVDKTVSGTWYQTNQVTGSSTVLQLTVQDSTIMGNGMSTLEAGPAYTLSVTGIVTATRLDLDFTRQDGRVGHFRGTRTATDSITGSLYYTGLQAVNDPIPATFVRVYPLYL